MTSINTESNYHKKISNVQGLNKYVPRYLGQTYFGSVPVIKSEFIEQSIEEYMNEKRNEPQHTVLIDLMLQMFDAIHILHQQAKLLHKDIKLDNFRI